LRFDFRSARVGGHESAHRRSHPALRPRHRPRPAPLDDPAWSPRQSALLRAVDELHADAHLSDAAWSGLREHLDEPEAIEFLVLAGWYRTIAYVANGVEIVPEVWALDLPER
jgi:alkylhydroperoxidase family enzyme